MWEGLVTHIDGDYFTAIVYEVDGSNAVETGEFKIELVEQEDIDLVSPGAIFTWGIENKKSRFRFLREGKLSEQAFLERLVKSLTAAQPD